ncbi:NAD-dependent epimerase/dehydratase family protein [Candidatus Omnitrophota bacterium]
MSFWKDKKVLVTGAAGFVGVNMLHRLVSLGATVRATVHRKDPLFYNTAIDYFKCDLTNNLDCLKAVEDIDLIYHCAANTSGAATIEKTPLVHVTPNIVMNAQLLEAAYFAGVKKFVWIGSSTGYPLTDNRPVEEHEMMDGDPYEKYFCVGWMKRYTEVLCQTYALKLARSMPTVVLRPTNIYGDFDDYEFETSHVFAALIRRVVERQHPFEVWGTGEDIRDLIYIDDFVDAMICAAEKCEVYDAFNIGLGEGYSVNDVLSLMLKEDGFRDAQVVYNTDKPTMIPVRLVDVRHAKKVLGFEAKTTLPEGIRKTLLWYRENKLKEV